MKKNTEKLYHNKGLQHWHLIALWLVIYDVVVAALSYFLALWFRFDCRYSLIPSEYLDAYVRFIPIYAAICVFVFYLFRMYHIMWRFVGIREAVRCLIACFVTGAIHILLITVLFIRMPYSYYFIGIVIQFIFVVLIRFAYRFVLARKGKDTETKVKKVMLIGAGNAGQTIALELDKNTQLNEKVVCVIDDNPNKWKRYIYNIPIVGGRETIIDNAKKYHVEKIIFAIPGIAAKEKKEILDICSMTGCELQSVPGLYQLVNGEISIDTIKNVKIEDLLGRDEVTVDTDQILEALSGKVVMVTGGGGSIGSELCRQIAAHNPKLLIIFDIYENNAYEIQQELKRNKPNLNLQVIIGSVRDSRRLHQVFEKYRPAVVFHAAAHKHVPLMEDSPCEAIKNNAIGTYKVAYAAITHGCKKFVMISTDKAVNPTNIMGASKRIAEMVVQMFARKSANGTISDIKSLQMHADIDDKRSPEEVEYANTQFVAVRFGNVLGSNGSVIPLFRKQIEEGGPVTVTHKNIIRFFMTISEAVNLVLQASAFARNGEIYVLDMGDPVKIDDLARQMIRLSGHTPDVDIKIKYVGLRPGEKMYEEKLMDEEGLKMTSNKLIYIGKPMEFDENKFVSQLKELLDASNEQSDRMKQLVASVVDTYTPEL